MLADAKRWVCLAVAGCFAPQLPPQDVSFARDVLPLLSDRCYTCHGPDARTRKAKLRLDDRGSAFADRGGHAAVVPGRPDLSELMARITATDPEQRMPPPESNLSLSSEDIAILRRWIEQGAEWSAHWAFTPPQPPVVPAVVDASWPRSDLDRFVLARLEAHGRRPSPPADPGTLLRRVTLDLTGLPPTVAELEAFLADPSDPAYDRVVDRLLASPRYGERMAWPWLEAARYADTDGFQNDPTRTMWPWRDWLIRALNDNVPFDRFTVEVLAGDLLPEATMEQVLASGFNRNHAHNGEGGRIAEETRVENVFDRTETTATVWLGLTLGCARCHDHKFDPITQRDYYRMFAFFDQTSESGSGPPGRVPPTLQYLPPDLQQRLADVEAQIEAAIRRQRAPDPELDAAQATWATATAATVRAAVAGFRPTTFGDWWMLGPLPAPDGDATRLFDTRFGPEAETTIDRSRRYDHDTAPWRRAADLADGEPHALPAAVGATYLHRIVDAPDARVLTLSLGSDDGIRVWCNGEEVLASDVQRGVAPDQERIELPVHAGANELLVKVVNTGGAAGIYFRKLEESVAGLPQSVVQALLQPADRRDAAAELVLLQHFRARHSPAWRAQSQRIAELRAERDDLRRQTTPVMVMDQLPSAQRRTTHLLERGTYDRPGEAVTAGTPGFLPPLPDAAPRDRLALARWLVSGTHPLTARVAVNRAWQLFFDHGLVKTSEDFGRQGSRPTHPALLDWLAEQFVASGWDTKALHRAIVTSSTYRQAAAASPAAWAEDPDNEWLARGARFRMPAWMLRDHALALSGHLVEQLGGPPVRPYQPEGVWAEATFDKIRYRQDGGDALYRRSVYVFWRRIVGPTFLFDTPARQSCVVRNSRTDTPLHALTTLNDTAFVEAARLFAERAYGAGSDPASRITWAFRAATSRAPQARELQRLLDRWRVSREHFTRDPSAARALLAVGAAPHAEALPAAELAAHTVIASILLNLDEVLTRP